MMECFKSRVTLTCARDYRVADIVGLILHQLCLSCLEFLALRSLWFVRSDSWLEAVKVRIWRSLGLEQFLAPLWILSASPICWKVPGKVKL